MEKTQVNQGKSMFIRKFLIFLALGICCVVTELFCVEQGSAGMTFGEKQTTQEILLEWDDVGTVYPVGKLEKLDINEATKKEWMNLPNIGETLASRILAYKEEIGGFTDIMELDDVEGIGEKTMAAISDYIKV